MTVKTNYFDGGGISYAAADLIAPFASLLTNGVFGTAGGALQVLAHSPANLSVDVSAGSCHINGYYVKNDAVVNVPIGANTSGYNRIDNIVANVDTNNKVTSIIDVQGIPSSSPVAPAVGSNQLLLAQVLVGNNVSVLNQNIITDSRVNVDIFGGQLAAITNCASISSRGWFKDQKTGLIFEWGSYTNCATTGENFDTFPLAFPHAVLNFQVSISGQDAYTNIRQMKGYFLPNSTSQYHLRWTNVDTDVVRCDIYWFAIGY